MSYALQEQYTSKNQVPGPSAGSVWSLGPRKVTSITIHHWGELGQQFDTVRDFLCTNNTPTSAHYVAEAGTVACIVSPDDCAFHAGNAEGNTFSVGIECRPEATDGDYQTVAELIAFLRGLYGDIPLHPHNYWYSTACPGAWDLTRLDALARSITPGTINPQSTTPAGDFLMTLSDAEQRTLYNNLDYIASAKFKADIFTGTTDLEKGARHAFHLEGLNTPVPNVKTGGTTTPATEISWNAANFANVPGNVLNAQFKLPDGTVTNLAGILTAIHATPVPTATVVSNVTADPQAIADAIVNGVNIQIVKK